MHPLHAPYVPLMHTLCPYAPYVPLAGSRLVKGPQITGIYQPNLHKILTFPHHLLKRSHAARIDELADSNEPAIIQFCLKIYDLLRHTHL